MTTPLVPPSAEPVSPVTGFVTEPVTGTAGGAPLSQGAEPAALIRFEQRMDVSTTWVASETVRVRRRVVTETRMVPVEVRVEVLEVERRPLTSATATGAMSPPELQPQMVFVLHEEVPVVTVAIQPTERITVGVRTVTTELAVTDSLRSERVAVSTAPELPAR